MSGCCLAGYLIVVIVTVDMVPVEGDSQICSDGVNMDRLQFPGLEARLLVVTQRHVPVGGGKEGGYSPSNQLLC